MDTYPDAPARGDTDTSAAAAEHVEPSVKTIRHQVLKAIRERPMTTEEIATVLGIGYPTVQPRTSELRILGKIEDSGARRPNMSGRMAIVWMAP